MDFKDAKRIKKILEPAFSYFAALSPNRLDKEYAPFLNRKYGLDWFQAELDSLDLASI